MSSHRTAWHPPFVALLDERCPPGFEVRAEVELSHEPQRADLLLVRRRKVDCGEARVLRRLWGLLSDHTLIEYKSGARPPRRGDLEHRIAWEAPIPTVLGASARRAAFGRPCGLLGHRGRPCSLRSATTRSADPSPESALPKRFGALVRLAGYGPQYHAPRMSRVGPASNLTLVLMTAKMTRTIEKELGAMGWRAEDLGGGYRRVTGASYPMLLVFLDEVSKEEADPLIGAFGTKRLGETQADAVRWLLAHVAAVTEVDMSDLDGFEEIARRMSPKMRARFLGGLPPAERMAGLEPRERMAGLEPRERMAGLEPRERLEGLEPRERLEGLSPDQAVLALPDALLAEFPPEFVERLPEPVRAEIRRRLAAH